MSPSTKARLAELRETMNARFTVIADDGVAVLCLVDPYDEDLPAFHMFIGHRFNVTLSFAARTPGRDVSPSRKT